MWIFACMINLLKIFNQTMVSAKGKESLPYHQFLIHRLWCYVSPCVASVPLHVLNEVRIITVQERASVNFMPLVGPLLNMDSMFYRSVLLPFTLERYFVKGSRCIHDKWNWLLHPKLTEDPLGMSPLHYPKVDQWHLSAPNMLPDSAIRRQGAQRMRVRLPYSLYKWIMFVIVRHHTNLRLHLWYVIWKAWNFLLLFVHKIFKDYWAESKITAKLCSKY